MKLPTPPPQPRRHFSGLTEHETGKCGTGILPVNRRKPSAGSRCHVLASRSERLIHLAYCFLGTLTLFIASCATRDTEHHIVISTREQKLAVLNKGQLMATYPISTSKFGLGDARGTGWTPLGELEVADKIGGGATVGTVFKDRRPTGEIVSVDAPGRDPIVTRILWLRGREPQNANAYPRMIYIHGTPEERNIGIAGQLRLRANEF